MKNKFFYEASVPQGLEQQAWMEITDRFSDRAKLILPLQVGSGILLFTYGDNPRNLLGLKGVLSLFSCQRFDVPRPKALLGHENLQNLFSQIDPVIKMTAQALPVSGSYKTLYIAAAGSESAVMQRLAQEISAYTQLRIAGSEGDLLVRLRRPRDGSGGWDVMVRMTPRPLSVRRWRTCDYEGALNAAVASLMMRLTDPQSDDVILNLACGSGTLLIERAFLGPARLMIGCDTHAEALRCAHTNLRAADLKSPVLVTPWDARVLPLADGSVNVVCADLPFGHDVGSHEENLILYPQLLKESARVTREGGQAVLLTHEIRLMETLLNISDVWQLVTIYPITINGLNPRVYLLQKGNRDLR